MQSPGENWEPTHVDTFFKSFYLFNFREGMQGEREEEKHQYGIASRMPPIGDLAPQPRHVPNWESNRRPLGLQAGTQSTEPHQPGLVWVLF